ncbi:MAG: Rpp14/Pop5 family protein [Methanobacteriota archaeon]
MGFRIDYLEKPVYLDRSALISTIIQSYQTHYNTDNIFFRITRFNGNAGILKCSHQEKTRMIHALQAIQTIASIPVKVRTVVTSGTIKSVVQHPQMKTLSRIRTQRTPTT